MEAPRKSAIGNESVKGYEATRDSTMGHTRDSAIGHTISKDSIRGHTAPNDSGIETEASRDSARGS